MMEGRQASGKRQEQRTRRGSREDDKEERRGPRKTVKEGSDNSEEKKTGKAEIRQEK